MISRLMRRVALRNFDDIDDIVFARIQTDRMNYDAVNSRTNAVNNLFEPLA